MNNLDTNQKKIVRIKKINNDADGKQTAVMIIGPN